MLSSSWYEQICIRESCVCVCVCVVPTWMQHLDDLAESFMMSVMFNGTLRTMKANYTTDDGS